MGEIVNRALTDRERFALDYEAHYNTGRWAFIYLMSREKMPKTENPETVKAAASRWKNLNIIKEYFAAAKLREQAKLNAAIDNYINSNTLQVQDADGKKRVQVIADGCTMSDEEIRRELVRIVKFGELDDKEKAAALVKLGEYQRKGENTDENTQIHRLYTPIQCKECILYRRAKKQLPENQTI